MSWQEQAGPGWGLGQVRQGGLEDGCVSTYKLHRNSIECSFRAVYEGKDWYFSQDFAKRY